MPAFENCPSKKVKVCCFCERWGSGGIESFLCNVLLYLDMRAVQLDVVAVVLAESIFTERLRKRSVRFFELSGDQRDLRKSCAQFRELLERERYDVVHLHIFHGLSLYYACLAEQAGVPVRIAHSHNSALRRSMTRPVKMLLHEAAKARYTGAATELWACSKPAAAFLFSKRALGVKGYQFIPNGIEIGRFRFDPPARAEVRKELGLEDQLVIGNVGRLCCQKNQTFLLDVFSEVQRQKAESRLLLVGKGECYSRLTEQAKRLGIADKVLFYGAASRVERLFWAMDAFVLPSRFEGLPVTAIEAQAAGLPCLLSDSITEECHVSADVCTLPLNAPPRQWAERILRLRAVENRFDGAAAVQTAGFDAADVARRLETFYLRSRDSG